MDTKNTDETGYKPGILYYIICAAVVIWVVHMLKVHQTQLWTTICGIGQAIADTARMLW